MQVVVVGAGPVGLMLAGELRLGGAEVVVLERRETPITQSRASTLHARTMELFDSRGLLADLGTPPQEPRGHFGGIPMDLTLPSSHPGQWKVAQTRTEELLQKWALSLGADLRRGWEVTALSDDGAGVEVTAATPGGRRRLRAAYLVACDGDGSTVRRLTGADFPGRPARRELIRADVEGIDIPPRRFERLPRGLAIAARMPGGVTRVMAHAFGRRAVPRTAAPGFAEVVELWRLLTGEDIGHGRPVWINSFDDANRQLSSYRHGRVLFAGDAAHVQMPSGGQALNLGLQDAVNLGWKLAAEVGPRPVPGLLDTYHRERHAVGAAVLANIRAQGLLLLGGPEVEPVRALLAELMAAEPVRAHLAGTISGLDIRYPMGEGPADAAGPVPARDEAADDSPAAGGRSPAPGGGPADVNSSAPGGSPADARSPVDGARALVGARLPDLRLETAAGAVTTAELLRAGGGLLLDLAAPAHSHLRWIGGLWAGRVTTVAVRATADSPLGSGGAVLVRPDGYVAWAGEDREGALAALRRWFGPPEPAQ